MAISPAAAADGRPNVLIIQTDDQRKDGTMGYMPETRRMFAGRGVTFTQGFVTTPLCCPSRATLYSGRYVHNHGIKGNDGTAFDNDATWLADLTESGYYTGLLGKYLNHVPSREASVHFARSWSARDPEDPRLAAGFAQQFLDEAERRDGRPWALVVNTYSPHVPLETRPLDPRSVGAYIPKPSFDESDLSDKHPNIQLFRELVWLPARQSRIERIRKGQILELQAVDEMVASIFDGLDARGESANTLSIYLSDNGYYWGEHSLTAKERPHDEAVRIPFYARWPGTLPARATRNDIVANVDVAATIYDATGIEPTHALDGHSFLIDSGREWLFTEGFRTTDEDPEGSAKAPPWVAYFDGTRHYIRWDDGFVEDYDLQADPYEMDASNVIDPEIESLLSDAALCAGPSCP